jgi:ribosomal protein S18 acetylase RimI-like enzyme
MKYTIRQATDEDLDILDRIHRENMKGYVEKVYPWNSTLFRERFIAKDYQIIEIKERIIGFIKVVIYDNEIYLGEIQINSNDRNKGIGTSLIKSLIQQAQLNSNKLSLKVVKGNPAERLYKRLGFTVIEESHTHKKMELKF